MDSKYFNYTLVELFNSLSGKFTKKKEVAFGNVVVRQGEDICLEKSNKNRVKSSGFIITKDHKTVINNLVPYTHYNIEFSYILEDHIKNKSENTLPTGKSESNSTIRAKILICRYTY